jgi:hypothetical protein
MIALVVILIRLGIACVVLTARLAYWMLKAIVVLIAAGVAAISAVSTSRRRRAVGSRGRDNEGLVR